MSNQSPATKALIDGISAKVKEIVDERHGEQEATLAQILAVMHAIMTRLEALSLENGEGAGKRPPRGERQTGGGRAAANNAAAPDDPYAKANNSRLYFITRVVIDPEYRERRCGTESARAAIEAAADKLQKKAPESTEYYRAMANVVYDATVKNVQEVKDEIKHEYDEMKRARQQEQIPPALTPDAGPAPAEA